MGVGVARCAGVAGGPQRSLPGATAAGSAGTTKAAADPPLGPDGLPLDPTGNLAEVRWMLEELRVSFFAQQLGTAAPVSATRIRKALAQVQPA